ncbi:MAG: hypothetical protein CM1200mP1_03960 [Candidatus Neomarinimicrobiota bacterium]|nr:MAG: hypothetical protein CM1200mP1_03960 [Candidatus Neomarinimicrobiota bacterium]
MRQMLGLVFLFVLSCDVDEQVSVSLPITDIDMEVPTITINQPEQIQSM